MKLSLGDNIRARRKAMGITQEQLAEAVGVTVGAVSKWETELSCPDILMLADLADFFETSIDTLLGYNLNSRTIDQTIAKIRELANAKNYAEAKTEAEKALIHFPNNFDVVYRCAKMYQFSAIETKDKASRDKAIKLYTKAAKLIDQNTDPKISALSIQAQIGEMYLFDNKTEQALEQLKKYNACGISNATIGLILTRLERYDEALTYLSESLLGTLIDMFKTAMGLASCYAGKNDYDSSNGVIQWVFELYEGLKKNGEVSYIHRIDAMLMIALLRNAKDTGDNQKLRIYLERARSYAAQFDTAPNYSAASIKFYNGEEHIMGDDFGKTAEEGVLASIMDEPELLKLWHEVDQ